MEFITLDQLQPPLTVLGNCGLPAFFGEDTLSTFSHELLIINYQNMCLFKNTHKNFSPNRGYGALKG